MTELDPAGWGHDPEANHREIEVVPADPDLEWCSDFTAQYGGQKRARIKVENCFVEAEPLPHYPAGLTRHFNGEYFGEFVDGRIIRVMMVTVPEVRDPQDDDDEEDEDGESRMIEVPHLLLDQVMTNVEPLTHRKDSQIMVELVSLQEIELVEQYDFLR